MASSLIDHIEFAVRDAEASRAFYEAALAPLDVKLIRSLGPKDTNHRGNRHGFGRDGYPSFWIHDHAPPTQGNHVAFAAESRAKVREFHAAAIDAGGRDNGPPGIREHYHDHYYAAFVLDPDGINVEAVFQGA